MFTHLSDDQVEDAYAIYGGIARSVLLQQVRGRSLADLRTDVKGKIAAMGEDSWKVRSSAAWAARAWAARAACFWQGCEGSHAGHNQTVGALALSIQAAAAMNLILRDCRVLPAQACLNPYPKYMTYTCMPCLDCHMRGSMQAVYDTLKGDIGFHEGSDLVVHWDAPEEDNIPLRSEYSPLEDRIRGWAWASEIRHKLCSWPVAEPAASHKFHSGWVYSDGLC